MKKVSFVCTTYRRFACVERVVAQFFKQTYENKELIIFNTDEIRPYYTLDFSHPSIIIINNHLDYQTGLPYQNRGQICRDAVTHASGDYFLLADDDDIYLPWHIQQAVDGIESNGKDAWKPEMSFFALPDKIEVVKNTMEASVIVKMNRIREIGFTIGLTGYEGLAWYTKLRDELQLDENNKNYVPSYCFNWGDPQHMAGHKQSGDLDNPDNFENHKKATQDFVTRAIRLNESVEEYQKYFDYLKNNKEMFNQEYYEKYALPHLS